MSENQPGSRIPPDGSSRDESPDDPMRDYDSSTPLALSFAPSSGSFTIPSGPGSIAMSWSTSAPYQTGKPSSYSTTRQHSRNPTNPTERLKRQIAQAFKIILSTIHQSQDENLIAGEFRWQEAQLKEDAELAKDSDKILEDGVLELKNKVKNQDTTWQQVLHDHEERADQLLMQQKDEAATQQQKDRQEAWDLLDKQRFEFQALIQTLTARIDHAEKPHYTIPPTDGGNCDPGPSNWGQQNPWIPPDGINPDKESASTPQQNNGK